jgi:Beta-galactosidase
MHTRLSRFTWIPLAAAVLIAPLTGFAGDGGMIVLPEDHKTLTVLSGNHTYMDLSFVGWAAGWKYLGLGGELAADGNVATGTMKQQAPSAGSEITLKAQYAKIAPRQVEIRTHLSADKDTDLTYIVLGVNLNGPLFSKGSARVTHADGSTRTVALPLARKGLGDQVARVVFTDNAGLETTLEFDPALDVPSDGQARIVLATEALAAAPVEAKIRVTFPEEITFYAGESQIPQEPGSEDWYTFQPTGDHTKPSEIGMQSWLETPAGKHGRIVRRADELIYNGKPIKLWGLNVCYSSCSPDKRLADKRAEFYPKFGVNAVRLHKYADGTGWAGIQSKESFVEFDAEALDRLDYFIAKLKERGVYVKLSSTFGVKLGARDRQFVPYMDEFGKVGRDGGRVGTGHGSVFLSSELQDMQIRQIVAILEHRNPYTGLTYGEDPGVAVVELFNEDSALFFGTIGRLQKIPTLRRRAGRDFKKWLEARYGSKDALLDAWGKRALNSFADEGLTDESWEEDRIYPAGNPWFFDPTQIEGSQKPKRQRLFDTMLYLYEIQNAFYDRYVAAIRGAGYEGEILGSNWQAGRAFSHYYNLHSDYRVGLIDRHNYFGGGSGARIDNVTMLRVPGSGMLSAGMQQVVDRPFMLSEWIHVTPNEWRVEGPAILGAYAMGLQGWDVSFMFQNRDDGKIRNRVDRERWDVSAPMVMGIFPAVARQVLRGDVRESPVTAPRYVHLPSLHEGKLGFDDRVTQQHDVKSFDSDKVPAETLAVARCVVDFVDDYRDTPTFDLGKYVKDGVYTSATGQLRWYEGTSRLDGHFTMDTPGTKAVVGFAEGKSYELGEVTISSSSRFGAVYVTAQGPDEDIASSRSLLIVAIARARNTGMRVFADSRIISRGKPPVVMEPVRAEIRLRKKGTPTVHVLDHDGCRTGKTLPCRDGKIEIDGARDKTCYYLVTYE